MSQMYLAPFFAPEFHLSSEQIGILASVVAIAWAVSAFFFGALSDRFGRRPVLVPAIFLFSSLSWISGMVHNFAELLLVRALLGVAEGPCWAIITAIIEETSPPSRRGRNVGIVVSAAALVGLAAAPVLTTQVAARFGWRWAFFVAGIPGLLMGAVLWKFVKEPSTTESGTSHHGKARLSEYILILRFRNMWLSCIGAAGFMCWLFLLNVFAPLYITEVVHDAPTTAGFLLGASGLGEGLSRLCVACHFGSAGAETSTVSLGGVVCDGAIVPASERAVSFPMIAGNDTVRVQCGTGHRGPDHCVGACGNRAAAIFRHRDRPRNPGRGDHGGNSSTNARWRDGGEIRASHASADVGRRDGGTVRGRAVSHGISRQEFLPRACRTSVNFSFPTRERAQEQIQQKRLYPSY
jgi:MFS family permease